MSSAYPSRPTFPIDVRGGRRINVSRVGGTALLVDLKDGSFDNDVLAPTPPLTVKGNLSGDVAFPSDVLASDLAAAFGLAITRADIPTRTIPVKAFTASGFYAAGDLGAGARYVRGRGMMEIQDAAGTWWRLSVPDNTYNVGHFGAKGDGIADDGGPILLARDAIPASGGVLLFPFTGARYRVLGQIVIGDGSADMQIPSTKQNIFVRGGLPIPGTAGQLSNGLANRDCVKISYEGSALIESVIKFAGPMCCGMSGITVDGNKNAQFGVRANAVFRSRFEDLFIVNAYGTMRIDANGHAPVNTSIGASENLFVNVQGDSFFIDPAIPTVGFDIGYDRAFDGFALDVNRSTFIGCSVLNNEHASSAKLRLRGCDLITFINCFGFQGGDRLGAGIDVVAPAGQPHLPCEIALYNSPMYGRLRVTPNTIDGVAWAPDSNGGFGIGLFPYALGDAINPSHSGAADLNIPYGFYGYDDRGNEIGFFPQQRKFYGGYGYDAPASAWRNSAPVVVANTSAVTTLQAFNLAPRSMRSRPQNLGAFTNAFAWDRALEMKAFGTFLNNVSASETVRFRLVMGATELLNSGPITLSVSPFYRRWDIDLRVAATSSSKVDLLTTLRIWEAGSTGAAIANITQTLGGEREGIDVDLAVVAPIFLQVQMSSANANFVVTLKRFDAQLI